MGLVLRQADAGGRGDDGRVGAAAAATDHGPCLLPQQAGDLAHAGQGLPPVGRPVAARAVQLSPRCGHHLFQHPRRQLPPARPTQQAHRFGQAVRAPKGRHRRAQQAGLGRDVASRRAAGRRTVAVVAAAAASIKVERGVVGW